MGIDSLISETRRAVEYHKEVIPEHQTIFVRLRWETGLRRLIDQLDVHNSLPLKPRSVGMANPNSRITTAPPNACQNLEFFLRIPSLE